MKNNMIDLSCGIPQKLLPKSFQDAVQTTKALGYRYLWIDALCIIQDCPIDVAQELSVMGFVYRHSTLTIAIADARDSHQGFLQARLQGCCHPSLLLATPEGHSKKIYLRQKSEVFKKPSPLNLTLHKSPGKINKISSSKGNTEKYEAGTSWNNTYSFLRGPLAQRVWSLQERVLSPRVLHYTDRQLVFECCSGILSEAHPLPDSNEAMRYTELRKTPKTLIPRFRNALTLPLSSSRRDCFSFPEIFEHSLVYPTKRLLIEEAIL
jgi:hypothetical protein